MLWRAHRGGHRRVQVRGPDAPLREPKPRFARAPLLRGAGRLPRGRGLGAVPGPRRGGDLSLASGPPGAAVRVRPRARVALVLVRDPECGTRRAEQHDVLGAGGRARPFRSGGAGMSVKILIPTPLRGFVGGASEVEVEGRTVGDALQRLVERHGQLKKHLYAEDGKLRSFVNDEDVRYLSQGATALAEKDVVSIVPSVAGGAGPPATATPLPLSAEEIRRYSRHLIMPEVGLQGQVKLKQASVLLIGAGGLGSPLALYLAAAGVGRIGIVDFDVVDESNLQRQIIHGTSDVGRPKLDSARARLREVNPLIEIETYETRLTSENAIDLFRTYDIVADGTDNFPTRYLVNDACVLTGKPNVYGSIFRFEGQASVFATEGGPCYRCLYPEPPPAGLVPSCAEGGVLGVLPGIVGTIQAVEVIKLILGAGEPLIGRLLLFDAWRMSFRQLVI